MLYLIREGILSYLCPLAKGLCPRGILSGGILSGRIMSGCDFVRFQVRHTVHLLWIFFVQQIDNKSKWWSLGYIRRPRTHHKALEVPGDTVTMNMIIDRVRDVQRSRCHEADHDGWQTWSVITVFLQLKSNKNAYKLSSYFSLVRRWNYKQKYFDDLTLESL